MRKVLFLSLFSILSMISFGQIEVSMEEMRSDWKLIKQENGVEVYISVMECQMGNVKQSFLYGSVKVVNTIADAKNVSFTYELYYADGCSGCGASDEYTKYIDVAANATAEGSCDFQKPEFTILLVNPLQTEMTELEKLVINDFKVK